jgi:hypothetical protein
MSSSLRSIERVVFLSSAGWSWDSLWLLPLGLSFGGRLETQSATDRSTVKAGPRWPLPDLLRTRLSSWVSAVAVIALAVPGSVERLR